MSGADSKLKQTALRIANDIDGRSLALKKELEQAQLRVNEIQSKLEQARLARQRSINFSPFLGGEFQCPECWVRREMKSVMKPFDSQKDMFHCKHCGLEIAMHM
jgi:hypothetical protein